MKLTNTGSNFDLYKNDKKYGSFTVPLYGKHMVLDVTASIIVCKNLGIEEEKINELLKTFHNAKRRFAEEKVGNTIIIDDYAHHPTEINATLEAAKQKYPDKKIVAVFKPNTYSRTKDFTNEFIEVLSKADKTFLTEIDSDREKQEDYPGVSSKMITDKIKNSEIISEDEMKRLLEYKDDVICFMSCASVSHLIENLKKELN